MLVADLPQSLEVALRRRDVTSFTENRFEDESGSVSRSGLLFEEEFETVQGLFDEFVVRGGVVEPELVPVGVGSCEDTGLRKTNETK